MNSQCIFRPNAENCTWLFPTTRQLASLKQNCLSLTFISSKPTFAHKANRILDFLRRNLYPCPQDEKEAAYKGLMCPVLEHGRCNWDPQGVGLQDELESVQKRAARFVTGNCKYGTGTIKMGIHKEKEERQ